MATEFDRDGVVEHPAGTEFDRDGVVERDGAGGSPVEISCTVGAVVVAGLDSTVTIDRTVGCSLGQ